MAWRARFVSSHRPNERGRIVDILSVINAKKVRQAEDRRSVTTRTF
jgi:hypothetical protein